MWAQKVETEPLDCHCSLDHDHLEQVILAWGPGLVLRVPHSLRPLAHQEQGTGPLHSRAEWASSRRVASHQAFSLENPLDSPDVEPQHAVAAVLPGAGAPALEGLVSIYKK